MKKYEMITELKRISEEKGINLKFLNLASYNKNMLESIIKCFKLSDEEMTKKFNDFQIKYPASAEKLKNNFLFYGWGRYYIYTTV